MGSPWNRSHGPEEARVPPWAALPPCDERRCSAFPLGALAPVTAVCLGLFAVGVGGNAAAVGLLLRRRAPRPAPRLCLASLAAADLLVLLGLPFDLYRLWRSRPWVFGPLLCRLSLYLGEAGTYATLLHVTALSVERYLAVCRPLRARRLATCRRARALLAALWAAALLSAAPFLFLVGVQQDPAPAAPAANGTARAAPSPPGPQAAAALFSRECRPSRAQLGALRVVLWVTTAYFFLPFLCLSILYGLIGRQLARSRGAVRGPAASARDKRHRQTVRVLLVVVLAFIVCWLPFHVGRIVYINSEDARTMYFSQYFNIVALQLFYLSASLNPILYNLASKKYRAAARKLLLARQPRGGLCPSRNPGAAAGGATGTGADGKAPGPGSGTRPAAAPRGPGASGETGL
ncbi:motilin receptor [Dasypus novemcinctus]|uniref:motilin receptor n=1 Tax=Dasypus novemcinctus TaxID=9361 RepID=UPI00265F6748|nr:motilin receptor [Dasypus novemcinctus]